MENSDQYQLLLNLLQNIEKELEDANIAIERLQEQIAGDRTRPAKNEMDTVLKRALHYLECYESLYPHSGAGDVAVELHQLICEAKCNQQVEGVTLEAEPPKWEYKSYRYSENLNYASVFNQLGGEGWELVATEKPYAFFKRPL